ncbi:transport and Golgi organization 2 homolog [Mytilus californianus]|uniref:transport and Golgi organization 2 homolog n=1 Tax=Mytilus californianus TaxID=6549 RepID=UPI002246AC2D|nr:transport and Golgi organization 2 homolog [Mytilus californianus]
MCLLFMYLNDDECGDGYRVIIANNRDEQWDRPTKQLSFWTDNEECISGQDMTPGKENGTWLGVSKKGRIGILLNILGVNDCEKKGRGYLVNEYISSQKDGHQYINETIKPCSSNYNSFNLILMNLSFPKTNGLCCSNMDGVITELDISNGVFTCDNSSQGKPWQKSIQNRERFGNIVKECNHKEKKDQLVQELLSLLTDRKTYNNDKQLATQAAMSNMEEDIILERSAVFVWTPKFRYGTRTHSIILVDREGNCDFIEKTMTTPVEPDNVKWETRSFKFKFSNCTSPHL